jgi:DNA-binding beta-propeller fold protein YncE
MQWAATAVVALLLAGCATTQQSPPPSAIYYPPAPEVPKLQFLTSLSVESDLGPSQGRFTDFILGSAPAAGQILKPYGIALRDNRLFVCDTVAFAVQILDFKKRSFRSWRPSGSGRFSVPVNIAIDADGTRYVADTGRNRVLIFGPDEAFRGALGEGTSGRTKAHGRAPPVTGTTNDSAAVTFRPSDVLVTSNRLYVTDLKGQTVRVYDKERRELLFTIPRDPQQKDAKLAAPTNIAIDSQGRLYVSDTGIFRVAQFDAEGQYLRALGRIGDRAGEFARPKGITVDRADRLYVVDAAHQTVQIFDPEGRLLLAFGEPGGSAAPMELPAKVIVDYDHVQYFQKYADPNFVLEHLVLVSNQIGSRKVSVYGFGHPK